METTAVEPVFVDTNLLIYAQQAYSPFHVPATEKLRNLQTAGHALWISRQILGEYLSAMSRPGALTTPVPMGKLIADVLSFEMQFLIAEDGVTVTRQLFDLLAKIPCGGKQIHDANIAAIMLAKGTPNW